MRFSCSDRYTWLLGAQDAATRAAGGTQHATHRTNPERTKGRETENATKKYRNPIPIAVANMGTATAKWDGLVYWGWGVAGGWWLVRFGLDHAQN